MLGDLLNICWGLKHPGKEFCYLISIVWLWQYCLILSEGRRKGDLLYAQDYAKPPKMILQHCCKKN